MSEPNWRQQLKGVRAFVETLKEPEGDERDTKTIAGMFVEALGCIENGLNWLGQVNEQYEPEEDVSNILPPRPWIPTKPAMDFWLQAELAEDLLKDILKRLQRVEPLAPKEIV